MRSCSNANCSGVLSITDAHDSRYLLMEAAGENSEIFTLGDKVIKSSQYGLPLYHSRYHLRSGLDDPQGQ